MHNVTPIKAGIMPGPIKLPSSIEAEQAVLGSALANNAVLDRSPWLEPGDFFEPVHGRIWQALRQEHAAGRCADAVRLKRLFDTDVALADLNGAIYLRQMAQHPETIDQAVGYGQYVKKLARLRELCSIGSELAERASADDADYAAVIWSDFSNRLDCVLFDDTRPIAKSASDVCIEILEGLEKPRATWTTGIPALDASTGGGIQEGYVLGFEARPKNFKSGTAHSLLLALAQQRVPSAYFALEMGSSRLAKRMLGHIGGFNSAMFRHVDEYTITRTIEASRALSALPLWFVDCPGMKFSRLRAAAAQLAAAYGVKAFVLDYWQLVNPDQPTRNKADFLADVAQWCADHAHEHGTTWLICSQENRTGESYGSDGLAKACDWHAVLHKHEHKLHLGPTAVETLWMDVKFARDGTGDSIGDEKTPVLYIDPKGPHLAQLS